MDDCKYCGAHLAPGEVCDCFPSGYNRLTPENRRRLDSFALALVDAHSERHDLHATRKGGIKVSENELTEDERKFLNQFRKADTAEKIMTTAIMFSGSEEDSLDMVEGYTRSDFKRAIKRLRVLQGKHPEYADLYEEAIGHIRRVWLHREVPA